MQISPGMKVSDVCMTCFEHTNDQPCPEQEAHAEAEYWALLAEIGCAELTEDGSCIHSSHMAQVEAYL